MKRVEDVRDQLETIITELHENKEKYVSAEAIAYTLGQIKSDIDCAIMDDGETHTETGTALTTFNYWTNEELK